jgi:hypothetical protein
MVRPSGRAPIRRTKSRRVRGGRSHAQNAQGLEVGVSVPAEAEPPMQSELHDVQYVIAGIFVALTDRPGETEVPLQFTHVIRIVPARAGGKAEQSVSASGVHTLRLSVPYRMTECGIRLQEWQLVFGRDFLSLYLPHEQDEPVLPLAGLNDVRVLVCAPLGCHAEALGVVLTYLSFLRDESRSVAQIIDHINETDDFLDVWKHRMSQEVMRLIYTASRTGI